MSSYIRAVITAPESVVQLASIVPLPDTKQGTNNIINYLTALVGGSKAASIEVKLGAIKASLLGTFTGDPTAAQALTINGVTFTARASGAVANEFNIATGANGTALAAAINASVTAGIVGIVSATAPTAQTCLVTCIVPGVIGNAVTCTENMDNFSLAGSATKLAGGTDGTATTLSLGE
jgi:hypothetical protein